MSGQVPRGRLRGAVRRVVRYAAVALAALLASAVLVWIACPFPLERLERWPQSPLVVDRHGGPLLRRVAPDGQWRFPVPLARISPWLQQATIAIEDARFATHPGVDPLATGRAAVQNAINGRVVSGASTLTMQICRMLDDRPRTLRAKLIESFRALQLDAAWNKPRILETYLNIAPYGRNLRGVEAAARAYFGRSAADLSLAEAALLAGIPQSPARLRPDRFPDAARARRDRVLGRMRALGHVSKQQYEQAVAAPVIVRSDGRTLAASHAAWMALAQRPDGGTTTIDLATQFRVEQVLRQHAAALPGGSASSAVVIEIDAAAIRALVGALDAADPAVGQVNGAIARRSPGSALKPFLYAVAFERGDLTPTSLLRDEPIEVDGWRPRNFDRRFRGEVTVGEALRQSLNVPAIRVARQVGLRRCIATIEAAGVRLPDDTETRAGLSLAVGGTECSLLDLVGAYATIGRGGLARRPRLFADETSPARRALPAAVCRQIDGLLAGDASGDADWPGWFMCKTGTSSGGRDAWAVGHNGRYAIGVRIGNRSGGLTGRDDAWPPVARLFEDAALQVDAR